MTLIEIMVVIAILGMMATIITVAYVRYLVQAKVDGTLIQMENVVQALDLYFAKNGTYPDTEQGLVELVSSGTMRALPRDKWEREFEYIRHSKRSFLLRSRGDDGLPGGEGYDADLIIEIPGQESPVAVTGR
jgi:general secretion pathway protein G